MSEGEDPCEDAPKKSATGPAVGAAPASLLFLCGVSVQKFCEQNSTLHGLLGLACAKCVEACQIHDQFSDACDGIGAFCALEACALGQATGESVEGILTRLLGMQPTDDLKVMLETHATLFCHLQNFPTVTIDMVLKCLLLHLFCDHPVYPQFAGIDESISQSDVDYAQASRRILDAYLWAISSQAGANALLAGAGAPMPNKKCWDCGAPGKVHGDGHNCPALVLASMTLAPMAQTVATVIVVKVKMASLVVRLAASLVQGMPWLPPVWWITPRCLPSQTPVLMQHTCG